VLEPPSDIEASEGETVEFTCRLTPCMPPPAVSWYFETSQGHVELVAGDRYQLHVSDDGLASLVIENVRRTDSGVYTMSAASSAGTVQVTAVLTVHGAFEPTLNQLIAFLILFFFSVLFCLYCCYSVGWVTGVISGV